MYSIVELIHMEIMLNVYNSVQRLTSSLDNRCLCPNIYKITFKWTLMTCLLLKEFQKLTPKQFGGAVISLC